MRFIQSITILLISLSAANLNAQQLTQTIRGTIIDQVSRSPLPGATIIVANTDPLMGTSADADGKFRLSEVPVRKQTIIISFMGYHEKVMAGLAINSGKELVLEIQLEEKVITGNEVVITGSAEREKPVNELAVVSARSFTVEETQKYAAAINDPGRMATSFSGVVSMDDGNNQISVRGNAPNTVLWRMEGVEIPNPNHFANAGAGGGGVSILSAQTLGTSDFLTGAFPAEYGNALSGVFDLKLRQGNNEKHEHTFQAGVLGIDVASEGPFAKNYDGSYLVNYRYSTLSILDRMGIDLTGASTNFQDLSYNIALPAGKAGQFALFGFGGLSDQVNKAKRDTAEWIYPGDRVDARFYSNTGFSGLSHSILVGSNANLKTVAAASVTGNGYKEEWLKDDLSPDLMYHESYVQKRYTLSSVLTNKFSARSSLKSGVILNMHEFDLQLRSRMNPSALIKTTIEKKGSTITSQAFTQWTFKITPLITLNAGAHALHLALNNSFVVEPRTSLKYQFHEKQSVGIGYGMHSQTQPIGVYFVTFDDAAGNTSMPNQDLKFSQSQHFVAFYDRMLSRTLHLRTEVYYQKLKNIPVSPSSTSNLSIVNYQWGFMTDSLVSKGSGENYGLELTLEKFLDRDFYFVLSSSLYDSKYKTLENIWRNTRYNGNFAFALTSGKEWAVGKKNKVLGLNLKCLYGGGLRYTPLDETATIAGNFPVYQEDHAYESQNPHYFRTDIRISLKKNRPKSTSTISLDVQNATNRKNIGGQYYDSVKGEIAYWYQTPLIPVLSYKIEF